MDLPKGGDEPLVVNNFLAISKRFLRPQLFQYVVHLCYRKTWVLCLLTLTMFIELLAQFADAGTVRFVAGRKWEGVKAAGPDISRIVTDSQTGACADRPQNMNPAG